MPENDRLRARPSRLPETQLDKLSVTWQHSGIHFGHIDRNQHVPSLRLLPS
jgi:hypothetical protein